MSRSIAYSVNHVSCNTSLLMLQPKDYNNIYVRIFDLKAILISILYEINGIKMYLIFEDNLHIKLLNAWTMI